MVNGSAVNGSELCSDVGPSASIVAAAIASKGSPCRAVNPNDDGRGNRSGKGLGDGSKRRQCGGHRELHIGGLDGGTGHGQRVQIEDIGEVADGVATTEIFGGGGGGGGDEACAEALRRRTLLMHGGWD